MDLVGRNSVLQGGLAGLLGRLLERLGPFLAQGLEPVLQRTDDRHLGAFDRNFLLSLLGQHERR